jgi:hypothetical protein
MVGSAVTGHPSSVDYEHEHEHDKNQVPEKKKPASAAGL